MNISVREQTSTQQSVDCITKFGVFEDYTIINSPGPAIQFKGLFKGHVACSKEMCRRLRLLDPKNHIDLIAFCKDFGIPASVEDNLPNILTTILPPEWLIHGVSKEHGSTEPAQIKNIFYSKLLDLESKIKQYQNAVELHAAIKAPPGSCDDLIDAAVRGIDTFVSCREDETAYYSPYSPSIEGLIMHHTFEAASAPDVDRIKKTQLWLMMQVALNTPPTRLIHIPTIEGFRHIVMVNNPLTYAWWSLKGEIEAGHAPQKCLHCEVIFTPERVGQVFCDNNCQNTYGGRVRRYKAKIMESVSNNEPIEQIASRLKINAKYLSRQINLWSKRK